MKSGSFGEILGMKTRSLGSVLRVHSCHRTFEFSGDIDGKSLTSNAFFSLIRTPIVEPSPPTFFWKRVERYDMLILLFRQDHRLTAAGNRHLLWLTSTGKFVFFSSISIRRSEFISDLNLYIRT
jgi:hypothetical protein